MLSNAKHDKILDKAISAVERAMKSVPSNSSRSGRIESLAYAKELIEDLKKKKSR